jgi:uncharacterized protein (DUF2252 family)
MLTMREARDRGRLLRETTPRSAHAELTLPDRDPVAILVEQNENRLANLIPVRIGRMLLSPFAYYRGTAAVMAHDLSTDRVTGEQVVSCGDAHISNFGLFASPERRVLFDLNDFDETSIAPWEWDVKRLAASVVIGGRDRGLSEPQCRDAAQSAVRAYRETLQEMHRMSALERYFYQVETDWVETVAKAKDRSIVRKKIETARRRTSEQVRDKLVAADEHGSLRFIDAPPTTRHVPHPTMDLVQQLFAQYCATVRSDTAYLLTQFKVVDYVLRAVGVGSVGTRCYVVMLEGPSRVPLFLQVKEAPPSVLETYGRRPLVMPEGMTSVRRGKQAHRVVSGQRILQAQSDPFLGWIAAWKDPERRRPADYYWRQFRDMKGSVRLELLTQSQYASYVGLCGRLLARAHSQSPGGAVIVGYLGKSERFEQAVAAWSVAYANQVERDFTALSAAVRTGRLPAEQGV